VVTGRSSRRRAARTGWRTTGRRSSRCPPDRPAPTRTRYRSSASGVEWTVASNDPSHNPSTESSRARSTR
jgi:hypothetical protein